MTGRSAIAGRGSQTEDTGRSIAEKEFGFWVYLMSDAIIFALLFATYAMMSRNAAGGPTGSTLFKLSHTFAETMLLLASSATFGFSSVAIEAGQRAKTLAWLCVTFLLGLGFVGMEISEFHSMVAAGAGPDRSGFLSAFFTLVGTHGLHVSVGLVWIVILGLEVGVRGLNRHVVSRLYRLGLFWHFLDIIWIGIFSIVYLPGLL
jgi:cytochrome o ubiquinol oxidase subunit III